jgi:hypothetical protein
MTAPLAVNDQAIGITASCYDDRRTGLSGVDISHMAPNR